MKSISRNPKACTAFIMLTLASAAGAYAADRVNMGFFSVAPTHGWHNESNDARLFSTKTGRPVPPLLILDSCKPESGNTCPRACDLPTIERSGFVANPGLAFKLVKRADAYVEYEASDQMSSSEGTAYTSIRLLCGRGGFIYAAQVDENSAQDARRDLDAVLGTIRWHQ